MAYSNRRYDDRIIGVLSNRNNKYTYSHFRELSRKYIRNNCGIIYLYNNDRERESILNHFKYITGNKFEEIMERHQVIILPISKYTYGNDSIGEAFYNYINSTIETMKNNSFTKTRIYLNVDEHINDICKDDLKEIFRKIDYFMKNYDTRFILRFFMDEITNFNFFATMSDNGYFVVENVEKEDFLLSHYPEIIIPPTILLDNDLEERQEDVENSRFINVDRELLDRTIHEVGHDLKNIFATISGYSQLAMLKTDSDEIKGYLKIIMNNSLDVHKIIERIDYQPIDLNTNKSIYNFNSLVKGASEMCFNMKRDNLNWDRAKVRMIYSLNSKFDILCNKSQIDQVIMNIVDNGIQSLNQEGTIGINTYDSGTDAILEIIDNGSGIEDSIINKIFDPYFTTKEELGMGLGLNISKNILKEHRSTISVSSKIGEGTRFTIVFPSVDKKQVVDNGQIDMYNII